MSVFKLQAKKSIFYLKKLNILKTEKNIRRQCYKTTHCAHFLRIFVKRKTDPMIFVKLNLDILSCITLLHGHKIALI